MTKIDSYFAKSQEAFRKDVERAFGVLKKKFQVLSHSIWFHYQDDIFFVVFVCIAMHNMMVQYRIDEEGVSESESFYCTSHLEDAERAVDDNGDDELIEHDDDEDCIGDYDMNDPSDAKAKYDMVQKRWNELYNSKEAKRLQNVVKNQLYVDRFGVESLQEAHDIDDTYNPLTI